MFVHIPLNLKVLKQELANGANCLLKMLSVVAFQNRS